MILNLIFLSLLLLVFTGMGFRLLRTLRLAGGSLAQDLMFALALGSGITAYVVLGLGLLGWLHRWIIIGAFAVFVVASLPELHRLMLRFWNAFNDRTLNWPGWASIALLAALTWFVLGNLVASLAPPIYGDALTYHLAAPKTFLRDHQISFIPFYTFNLPFTLEMLFLLAMVLRNDVLAALIQWALSVVTAGGIYLLARQHFALSRRDALLGATTFYAMPMVTLYASAAKPNFGLALFTLLAVHALFNWRRDRRINWLILAGIMAGLAGGIKTHGLFSIAGLTVLAAVEVLWIQRRDFREALRAAGIVGGVAGLVVSPWYLKNWVFTGNPLWPFFYSILGGRDAGPITYMHLRYQYDSLLRAASDFILGPWRLTVEGTRFGLHRNNITPVFLAFVPLVWFRASANKTRLRRDVALLLLPCLVYYAFWFYAFQYGAHTIGVLPLLAVAASVGMRRALASTSVLRTTAGLAIAVSLLFGLGVNVIYNAQFVPVVLGEQSTDRFLEEKVVYYPQIKWINQNLPLDSKLLVYTHMGYYLDRDYIYGRDGFQGHIDYDAIRTPADFVRRLQELGITHIMWDSYFFEGTANQVKERAGGDDRLRRIFATLEHERILVPIYRSSARMIVSKTLDWGIPSTVVVYRLDYPDPFPG